MGPPFRRHAMGEARDSASRTKPCTRRLIPSQHLARDYPDEIQVLNHQAFFWPMWYGSEIEKTHEEDDYDFRATGQYAWVSV